MIVKDLIGIPYKPHGRDLSGMDCYGVVIEMMKRQGKNIPDVFYGDTKKETNVSVLQSLEAVIPNTKLDKPEEGAVVELLVNGQPSHVGVCLGDGTFIHAMEKIGVVMEPLYRYKKRIRGYYRVH